MMRLLTLLGFLALSGVARAQTQSTDLIREDSAFGLLVQSLDDLRAKGDKLHKELDLKDDTLPRPTKLFGILFKMLIGSEKGIGKGPTAIVIPNPTQLGIKPTGQPNMDALNLIVNLVVVVPLSNPDDMAANFGFKKGDWKLGEVKSVKSAEDIFFGKLNYKMLLTEKFAYAALQEKPIKVLRESKAKPLSAALTRRQAQAVKEADAVLHIDVRELGALWKELVGGVHQEPRRGGGREGYRQPVGGTARGEERHSGHEGRERAEVRPRRVLHQDRRRGGEVLEHRPRRPRKSGPRGAAGRQPAAGLRRQG